MPGIAGILSADPQAAARLERMVAALAHDPAYTTGHWHEPARGIHVGWALHRGAFADCLPISNENGDVTMFFSGEVFTEGQQLTHLARQGHRFRTGDASHLVHWYEEQGDAFVEQLNGTFCGLLIDHRRGTALLFNDRYGAARLYVHQAADSLYFASEAKALLRVVPATRRLDAVAVAQTFSLGCVLGERTLFEGIHLLPPASCWSVQPDLRVQARTYFDARSWEQQAPLSDAQFPGALQETFAALLPQYFESAVRPAMSLTGGIDGRMIMACARREPGTLPCYSFGGVYRDCHDVKLARRIAAMCGQTHQTLLAGPGMLAQFPALAERCIEASDGTMDVSGAVEVYVNRLAREISPLRITGNYGSEIVRGNVAFRPRHLPPGLLEPHLEAFVQTAQTDYHAARQGSDLAFVAFKQVPWHHHARSAVEQSVLTPRSPYLDNRLVALMFRASVAMRRCREPSLRVVSQAHAGLAALPTDRGLVAGPPSPMARLRHALREFSVRAEYAYDYGMPQPLARIDRLLAPLRPESLFLGRHKFYHFRVWYRRELAPFVRDTLLAPGASAQAWYRPGKLRSMVEAHVAGRANHTLDLHRALTLELTQRLLIAAAGAA
jgi:asparagine synthase (glutamine-hydrolysing)